MCYDNILKDGCDSSIAVRQTLRERRDHTMCKNEESIADVHIPGPRRVLTKTFPRSSSLKGREWEIELGSNTDAATNLHAHLEPSAVPLPCSPTYWTKQENELKASCAPLHILIICPSTETAAQ